METLYGNMRVMIGNHKKIAILRKAADICKRKTHPKFTQAEIIRNAHKAGHPDNQTTKGTFSKYLAQPETSYENVPLVFYDVILDMFKEQDIEFSFSNEGQQLNAADLPHVLSLFMDVSERDQKLARQSLPGDYWGYMPSIEKPGCIVKFVLRIKENREGVITAEELFYYPKDGFSDIVKQRSQGYVLSKNGHNFIILDDPSSYLPKVYVMRMELSPSQRCLGFDGGTIIVSSNHQGIGTVQRKIRCTRSKDGIPNNKKVLIEEHGVGIHSSDTDDAVIQQLFDKLVS